MTIKELRTACDMTQKEFSEFFQIPLRTIENWEGEKSKPSEYLVDLLQYELKKEGLL